MKKLTKTQLAVNLSTLLTSSATDNQHLTLIKERQGNMATQVQEFLRCGLDRKDLIFAIQEALNDAEPVYLNRDHKATTQKNRRVFSAAWAKVFEGFTLTIKGSINYPIVTEEKKAKADPYKPFQNAVKKLEGILSTKDMQALNNTLTVAIEADKIKLAEAVTAQAKQEDNIAKRQTVMLTDQVTDSFIALGMEPSKEQVANGVKALQAVNA